jgi:hypothetical protein
MAKTMKSFARHVPGSPTSMGRRGPVQMEDAATFTPSYSTS